MRNKLHFVILAVMVAVGTVLTYFGLRIIGPLPIQASAQSIPIDWLLNLEMMLTGFFFSIIMAPLVYSLVVFRRRKGETGDGQHIEGHTGLELSWVIIPLIVVVWLGIIGADNLRTVRAVDPDAIEVKVVAFQWEWQFVYPQGFTSEKLYLPVNKQAILKLESRDVLHSFWVPEFRIKQDIVPGRVEEYRITPNLEGLYKIRCAELCGTQHANMQEDVIVLSEEAYAEWLAGKTEAAISARKTEEADPNPNASRGEVLYNEQGCKACHSLDGTKGIGPTWKGVADSQVKLADGTTILADADFLFESIKSPNAKVVAGFRANAMPDFGLPDKKILDLVAFIQTLK